VIHCDVPQAGETKFAIGQRDCSCPQHSDGGPTVHRHRWHSDPGRFSLRRWWRFCCQLPWHVWCRVSWTELHCARYGFPLRCRESEWADIVTDYAIDWAIVQTQNWSTLYILSRVRQPAPASIDVSLISPVDRSSCADWRCRHGLSVLSLSALMRQRYRSSTRPDARIDLHAGGLKHCCMSREIGFTRVKDTFNIDEGLYYGAEHCVSSVHDQHSELSQHTQCVPMILMNLSSY
jgi:hypothetical protein